MVQNTFLQFVKKLQPQNYFSFENDRVHCLIFTFLNFRSFTHDSILHNSLHQMRFSEIWMKHKYMQTFWKLNILKMKDFETIRFHFKAALLMSYRHSWKVIFHYKNRLLFNFVSNRTVLVSKGVLGHKAVDLWYILF